MNRLHGAHAPKSGKPYRSHGPIAPMPRPRERLDVDLWIERFCLTLVVAVPAYFLVPLFGRAVLKLLVVLP